LDMPKNKKVLEKQLINGEPDIFYNNSVKRVGCCDCGLVHLIVTELEDDRAIQYIYRDDYKTKKNRKNEKIIVYKRKKS